MQLPSNNRVRTYSFSTRVGLFNVLAGVPTIGFATEGSPLLTLTNGTVLALPMRSRIIGASCGIVVMTDMGSSATYSCSHMSASIYDCPDGTAGTYQSANRPQIATLSPCNAYFPLDHVLTPGQDFLSSKVSVEALFRGQAVQGLVAFTPDGAYYRWNMNVTIHVLHSD